MDKEKKLEIWKNDAVDNGFTCPNCEYVLPVSKEKHKYLCRYSFEEYYSNKDFCSRFKFRKTMEDQNE